MPLRNPLLIHVRKTLHSQFADDVLIPKLVHRTKVPGRVDQQQRKRRLRRKERLAGQVEHHARVFADGKEHHGIDEVGHDFPDDVDALGFELL
jgi:hypothetical protein